MVGCVVGHGLHSLTCSPASLAGKLDYSLPMDILTYIQFSLLIS